LLNIKFERKDNPPRQERQGEFPLFSGRYPFREKESGIRFPGFMHFVGSIDRDAYIAIHFTEEAAPVSIIIQEQRDALIERGRDELNVGYFDPNQGAARNAE
jgi:hypothetical protein